VRSGARSDPPPTLSPRAAGLEGAADFASAAHTRGFILIGIPAKAGKSRKAAGAQNFSAERYSREG